MHSFGNLHPIGPRYPSGHAIADMLGLGMAEWYPRDADLDHKQVGVARRIDRHLLAGWTDMKEATDKEATRPEPHSPRTQAILALIQGLLPAMTAIIGGLWIVFTYIDHQKEEHLQQQAQFQTENATRLLEAKRPFLERQLAMYVEASQVAGRLVSDREISGDAWQKDFQRFLQLFWGELSMVEDREVGNSMKEFHKHLMEIEDQKDANPPPNVTSLQPHAYRLTQAFRRSIAKSWEVTLND